MITLEEFSRIDLRVAEVIDAETIAGTTRLLKVTVDLGDERRTLVGGLAGSYTPDDLRGLQVIVAVNLEPATIRGVRSEGMMLGVGCEEPGAVSLVTVHRPVRNGSSVE